MLLADVTAIALSIIGFLLSLQGVWLLCRGMFPVRVARAADRCRRRGITCFLLGIPVTGAVALFAGIAAKAGTPGQILAWVVVGLFFFYASTGLSGFVTHLGERLSPMADIAQPWRSTVRGGAALELAYLLPVIGWFGLLPASLILGAGATTLSFFGSRRNESNYPGGRLENLELPPLQHEGSLS